MNTAVYHYFHTWAVSHPTGVHSTVPSQSAPHQYDFSCAGPIRYMQPCVTLKTECTFDAIRQYSLCMTVSIQKLPHGIDTPTYHCIGTVPVSIHDQRHIQPEYTVLSHYHRHRIDKAFFIPYPFRPLLHCVTPKVERIFDTITKIRFTLT
ncbi:hypothetical protein [Bacteroides xylanisolvens]|uniref:hypothetical protein n=1 Tax=Bacteroides xylanisolvens TaxID=371601 RepID=UPI001BDB4052|nr:hypothetical protein [Bacteroides xylanisolvens]